MSGHKTTERNALSQQTFLLPTDEKCQLIRQKLSVGTFHLLASGPEFNTPTPAWQPARRISPRLIGVVSLPVA
jgi:hypothetical protein